MQQLRADCKLAATCLLPPFLSPPTQHKYDVWQRTWRCSTTICYYLHFWRPTVRLRTNSIYTIHAPLVVSLSPVRTMPLQASLLPQSPFLASYPCSPFSHPHPLHDDPLPCFPSPIEINVAREGLRAVTALSRHHPLLAMVNTKVATVPLYPPYFPCWAILLPAPSCNNGCQSTREFPPKRMNTVLKFRPRTTEACCDFSQLQC